MKAKRMLRRGLGVAAAATVMLVGVATPASAGENSRTSFASNGDGWAAFVADGDKVRIRDTQCDGGTVWAQISFFKSGYGWNYRTIHNKSGCNTTDVIQPWGDIPEGASVFLTACGGMASNYKNEGAGKFGTGSACDPKIGGQTGVA